MKSLRWVVPTVTLLASLNPAVYARPGLLDTESLPEHLRDRGEGVSVSMFGTYIRQGEILVYPFFEYYLDDDAEYSPAQFGYTPDRDFRGRYRASEGLIFLGYGWTKNLAIELEAAVIDATLEKSPNDPSGVPSKISESGIGDVQIQINRRWLPEAGNRPELFSYFEVVFPTADEKSLIGTSEWEFKGGTGVIRGFRWGTMTARAAAEYNVEEQKLEVGEVAIEHLKRLSPKWRTYLGVEGTQDEVELITEAQWHLAPAVFVKINNAFGLTSKATDWAPEVGIVFSF